jgi:xanthine dehydrogenase/oxidase
MKFIDNVKYKVEGDFSMGSQYHFTMEPQTCVCVPIEDGLDVYSSTQWMQCAQETISRALKVPENW